MPSRHKKYNQLTKSKPTDRFETQFAYISINIKSKKLHQSKSVDKQLSKNLHHSVPVNPVCHFQNSSSTSKHQINYNYQLERRTIQSDVKSTYLKSIRGTRYSYNTQTGESDREPI